MEKIDFSKANPNDFTQKDLMIHLLNVSQHSATREDVKEDISNLDIKLDKVESNLNARIDKVESNLNAKIDKVESNLNAKMDKEFKQVDKRFEQVDNRFDNIEKDIKDLKTLETKIQESKNETIKWIVGMFFANILAMGSLGFAVFKLFNNQ